MGNNLTFPDAGLGQGPQAFPLTWLLLRGKNLPRPLLYIYDYYVTAQ